MMVVIVVSLRIILPNWKLHDSLNRVLAINVLVFSLELHTHTTILKVTFQISGTAMFSNSIWTNLRKY